MEKLFAADFVKKISYIFNVKEDRDILFTALQEYRNTQNVFRLVTCVKYLVNHPDKIQAVDLIRTVIWDSDQIAFDKATHWLPRTLGSYLHSENHYRLVRIARRTRRSSGDSVASSVSLGFAVRGGLEHGTGIFVSHVLPDSIAWREGLRIGDQIHRVNGLPLNQSTHAEACHIIRNAPELLLKVQRIGMIPSRKHATSKVKWKHCSDVIRKEASKLPNNQQMQTMLARYKEEERNRPVAISLSVQPENFSLGCVIRSMPGEEEVQPNRIFIQSVNSSGLSKKVGLHPGDEILAANYVLLRGLSHADVMLEIKKSDQLNLLIKQQNPTPIPESQLQYEEKRMKTNSKGPLRHNSYRTSVPIKSGLPSTITSRQESFPDSGHKSRVLIVKEEPNPKFTYTSPPSIPLLSNNSKFNITNGQDEKQNNTRENRLSHNSGYNSHDVKSISSPKSVRSSYDSDNLHAAKHLPASPVLINPPMENRKTEIIPLTKNEFVRGFGIVLEEGHGDMFNNKFAVSMVQDYSPAYHAGISRGDFVLEIDGRELSKLPPGYVEKWLREIETDESVLSMNVKVAKISQEIYCELRAYF